MQKITSDCVWSEDSLNLILSVSLTMLLNLQLLVCIIHLYCNVQYPDIVFKFSYTPLQFQLNWLTWAIKLTTNQQDNKDAQL